MKQIGVKLYKLDSKNKVREWAVYISEDEPIPFYSVRHGQKDGALQETRVEVSRGKNIGRSNETTAAEQCELEALALHIRQKERKGYADNCEPTEKPDMPMLAHKYKDCIDKIVFPACICPKIDGQRLVIKVKDGKVSATTRSGKTQYGVAHITDEILALGKNITIDGELYSDKHTFQELMSIVRKSKSADQRMDDVFFYAFDLIEDGPYHQRVIKLGYEIANLNHTKIVPWHIVKSHDAIKDWHADFIQRGFEGSMIRSLDGPYEINKRSYGLLKNKDFIDEEYEIVGFEVGIGKYVDVPTFILKMDSGQTFRAVPKGKSAHRKELLEKAELLIGQMATVRFFEYTDEGIPRFPVMIEIRDYE